MVTIYQYGTEWESWGEGMSHIKYNLGIFLFGIGLLYGHLTWDSIGMLSIIGMSFLIILFGGIEKSTVEKRNNEWES